MIRQAFVVALALALTPACAFAQASSSVAAQPAAGPAYQLGAGDEIRVSVFGLDALTNTYVVGDAGTISMPLISEVPVRGRSTRDVEVAIANSLRERDVVKNPSVSVQVTKYRPFFILGEVQRPGQYPYVPGMSVLTAVSIAGGYTFRADAKKASISRNVGEKIIKGRAGPETQVMPGDTVLIPESWF